MAFKLTFLSAQRPPQCAPDPNFPDGQDLDPGQRPACKLDLPYPAECVGTWLATCESCGVRVGVTAAGRKDDPKSVMVPCKGKHN